MTTTTPSPIDLDVDDAADLLVEMALAAVTALEARLAAKIVELDTALSHAALLRTQRDRLELQLSMARRQADPGPKPRPGARKASS